ncbi:MAG: hypothetical protein NT076_00570 [Candidatus Pacearchaeota archaeon]|nr:hypothetical protein [Candidatus Pacearchaeota archaeon]
MTFFDIFSKTRQQEQAKELEKPKIQVDHREKNSLVIAELVSHGIDVEFSQLPVADFLVKGTAIERKTVSDFLSSMINQRLANQLQELQQYPSRLLLVEGIDEQELYSEHSSSINPNAIRGFLLSILLKHNVPILFTKDYKDTASFISVLARKQETESGIRAVKKSFNKKEQLQYILEGFPGIGPKTAKKLLKRFGNLKNIFNSSQEELKKEIGKKADVFKLVDENY